MTDWIRLRERLPEQDRRVRLLLRDRYGEFESSFVCALLADGDFYNVEAHPPVAIEPQILAWRPITPKPRADWPRFARTIRGGA